MNSAYFFKHGLGEYFYEYKRRGFDAKNPLRISDYWKGIEGNLDAVLTDADGDSYFFKASFLDFEHKWAAGCRDDRAGSEGRAEGSRGLCRGRGMTLLFWSVVTTD